MSQRAGSRPVVLRTKAELAAARGGPEPWTAPVVLVPTMGALHAGHLALVERAKRECAPVYASIFLNPTQFGPNEDLSKYPRPLEADIEKLTAAGVDGLFLPDPAEVYPKGYSTYVQVEGLSDRLEGKSRPGHFRGVATVVLKLFGTVQPHLGHRRA